MCEVQQQNGQLFIVQLHQQLPEMRTDPLPEIVQPVRALRLLRRRLLPLLRSQLLHLRHKLHLLQMPPRLLPQYFWIVLDLQHLRVLCLLQPQRLSGLREGVLHPQRKLYQLRSQY